MFQTSIYLKKKSVQSYYLTGLLAGNKICVYAKVRGENMHVENE